MKQQSKTNKDCCKKKKKPDQLLLRLRASGVDIDNAVALSRVSGDQRT